MEIRTIREDVDYLERTIDLIRDAANEDKFDRVILFLETLSEAAKSLAENYKTIFKPNN